MVFRVKAPIANEPPVSHFLSNASAIIFCLSHTVHLLQSISFPFTLTVILSQAIHLALSMFDSGFFERGIISRFVAKV
jgi:hypothetical protein